MLRLLCVLAVLLPSLAFGACRQALVLALDVSGSVNAKEYRMQTDGLADALDTPRIRGLILNGDPAPLAVSVFEWSSQNHQGLILPWTDLRTAADLDSVIDVIRTRPMQRQGLKTALGRALQFSQALLAQRPDCWRHTVDISGDGKNNIGPDPAVIKSQGTFRDITVNVLVVTDPPSDTPAVQIQSKADLEPYFQRNVIHGPGAFTMLANGFEDYAAAIERKLARELSMPILGSADLP